MQIGSLIKYHRTKKELTQNQLAMGICSIPHLSKIENNSKEANSETIRLLLDRLDVDLQDVEESERAIKKLQKQLLIHINYVEVEKADETFKELESHKEIIGFTDYIYLYEMYKLRYYLFKKDLEASERQIKWLQAHRQNFSQHEQYLLSYFTAIALILRGKYGEADEKLTRLVQESVGLNYFEGELYYHLALVKGYLEQAGHAIFYGKKALSFFTEQFNYMRILHVQMALAIDYSQSKMYEEALENYEHLLRNTELLKQQDLLPQVLHNIGDLKHHMGDYASAMEMFKKSAALFPKNTENYLLCLYNLAVTEYKLDRLNDSKRDFTLLHEEACKMKVVSYQLYAKFYLYLLADQQQKAMNFLENKVVPHITKTDELKDAHQTFSHILAEHYKREGKYEKAVQFIL
ncbi:tetratricopeptide repeat protein [Paenisporosarcina sp. NPDC076898]|uniref:tetratricopeptide repeat protein n=1 Tax=unclassified Paenisporosarcina TaxID=2642018 RepID=UPI003CFEAF20